MHTTTLQGVFPEPKPIPRRNFIKENVKSIKQMQGLLQEAGVIQSRPSDKFRNRPLNRSRDSSPNFIRTKTHDSKASNKTTKNIQPKSKFEKDEKTNFVGPNDQKFTHRSMQTERTDDLVKLYETGIIKYPSPNIGKSKITPRVFQKVKGHSAGHGDTAEEGIQSLDLEEKDYIKENMVNFKPKTVRPVIPKVPAQAPPTYQRGVLPKYLRDKKEDDIKEEEVEPCPEGHVLLPEEERKETLRVLRQSYADRIQELNSMPVRSDTLRVKRRKMEIEEELKRIDGGIKVFQRPKVYVKINA